MNALRAVAAYFGFIILGSLFAGSLGNVVAELVKGSESYGNNIAFWSAMTGLFGCSWALVAKHIFSRSGY